jgi:hypothetical protein
MWRRDLAQTLTATQSKCRQRLKAHEQLNNEVKPLMNEIENLVQQHLYGNEQL